MGRHDERFVACIASVFFGIIVGIAALALVVGDHSPWVYLGAAVGGTIGFLIFFFSKPQAISRVEVATKPGEPISPEKAEEYQQVAALVSFDLDLLSQLADNPNITLDKLRGQIKYTVKRKEEIILDAKVRRDRYNATSAIFSAMASGRVRSTPVRLS